MPDTQRNRPHVHVGQVPVQEVGHDFGLAGGVHLFRDLPAGVEPIAGQRDFAARTRQLHFEIRPLDGEHDEATLSARDFDRGIEHEREHLVEDPARAERTQTLEQRRELSDVAYRRLMMALGRQRHRRGVLG